MKRILSLIVFATLTLSGCGTLHGSMASLKANPNSTQVLHSERSYEDAHARIADRMRACMTSKFLYSEIRASADLYPERQIGVSHLYVPGLTGNYWLIVAETTPSNLGGSDVRIFSASSSIAPEFAAWLKTDSDDCVLPAIANRQ